MTKKSVSCYSTFILLIIFIAGCSPEQQTASSPAISGSIDITVLSSRADMVSGGDALLEISARGIALDQVQVLRAESDISGLFQRSSDNSLVGRVSDLVIGDNLIVATDRSGQVQASITLVNHPITGPIVSGPHFDPMVCRTEQSGLGAPLDSDCSALTKVSYYYKSSDSDGEFKRLYEPLTTFPADLANTTTSSGQTVPYIVRVEAGTINRAVYRIAVLDNPQDNESDWKPDEGWNRRLLFSFGGGCGTNYNQGTRTDASVLNDMVLSRGFAHALSSMNVMGHRCNDNLSAETLMMVKEHFIETFGVPRWTAGSGGSGGAIQQLLITQNYPGLLDGLMPSLSFADSFSLRPGVADCRLLIRYFESSESEWSDVQREAVEGYFNGTCAAWNRSLIDVIVADRGCGIPEEMIYNAETNPTGARCTIYDTNIASVGRDPETGYGNQALDNVGLQYGLLALNNGEISKEMFLDLNQKVGGYDRDGKLVAERTSAQLVGLHAIYNTGRVNQGAGGLGSVPILHYRSYRDDLGDIHDRFRDFQIRERILHANGRVDNQVIWIYSPQTEGYGAMVSALALDTMSEWLNGISSDNSEDRTIDKIVRAKPAAAVDGCWNIEGARIDEVATFSNTGRCNTLYPNHTNPRLAAGATLADDVVKCALKPVSKEDYNIDINDEEFTRLKDIFPLGVCDYTRSGVEQVDLAGTFLKLPL